MTPAETERFAHYETARTQLHALRKCFHRTLILNIVILCCMLLMSIIVTGLVARDGLATLNDTEPRSAYLINALGAFGFSTLMVLFLLGNAILAYFAAAEYKVCAWINTLLYGLMVVFLGLIPLPWYNGAYMVLGILACILNLRNSLAFRELDQLKQLEGYPHFSQHLSAPPSYQPEHMVKPEQDMEALGVVPPTPEAVPAPQPKAETLRPDLFPKSEANFYRIMDEEPIPQPAPAPVPEAPAPEQKPDPLAHIAAPSLANMDDGLTGKKQYDPQALPRIEEIRQRYAAQKQNEKEA